MLIRPLTENEGEIFWELRLQSLKESPQAFLSDYATEYAKSETARLEQFRNGFAEQAKFIFGGFAEDKLIAIAGLAHNQNLKMRHKAVVWGVYVAPEYRGQGVGASLLAELIRTARTIPGLLQLELGVVSVEQSPARKLYLSQGFEVYGREPRAIKLVDRYFDEELMVLNLD